MQSCNKVDNIEVKENASFVNPYEKVGHNASVDYVMSNLKSIPNSSKSVKVEVSSLLLIYKKQSDKTKSLSIKSVSDQIPDVPESLNETSIHNWVNNMPYSDLFKSKVFETFEILKKFSTIEELDTKLKNKEKEAANFFEGQELRLYYEHLAVARYSVLYWSNVTMGGKGGFTKSFAMSIKLTGKPRTKAVDYWKVFAVDCIGGVMGGPLGYAGASAIAVIMQSNSAPVEDEKIKLNE